MREARKHQPAGTEVGALSGPELRALAALLEHGTIPAAATAIDVPERTFRRWAAKPTFKAALRTERRTLMEGLSNQLAAGTGEVLSALRRVLRDPATPPTAVVGAVRVWLENARGTNSEADVAARLERIERLAEGRAPADEHDLVTNDRGQAQGAEQLQ